KRKDVRKLVIKLAMENRGWGYTKIRDALRTGPGIEIGRTTVGSILAEVGIEPAPEREKTRTWKHVKTHPDSLRACDFFSVEVLGPRGMVRCLASFVIALKTRAVEIAGIGANPGGEWTKQMARNLTDGGDELLRQARYLIHDRDPLFTEAFETILRERWVEYVKIRAQSPSNKRTPVVVGAALGEPAAELLGRVLGGNGVLDGLGERDGHDKNVAAWQGRTQPGGRDSTL
ncbi:MAG: transposase, partial [Deltaproteobacteria bacterium]|nr:transposase [Deltaproteobacteria bacterium]